MKLSIIVCTHNQKESLLSTLAALRTAGESGWTAELVVLDYNSSDGTRELLRRQQMENLQVIYLPSSPETYNWQLWHQVATSHLSGDYVLLDRSLTDHYEVARPAPAHITKMLQEIHTDSAAIYAAKQSSLDTEARRDLPSRVVNLLMGSKMNNFLAATKLVRSDMLKALNLRGTGPAFEADLTMKLLRAGATIQQVHVSESQQNIPATTTEQLNTMRAIFSARFERSIWKPAQKTPSMSGLASTARS